MPIPIISPILDTLHERFGSPRESGEVLSLREQIEALSSDVRMSEFGGDDFFPVQERIADLEIALDELGWQRMISEANYTVFTRQALKRIIDLCRIMYLKNPLINRIVEVQRIYIWAAGWNVKAEHELINDVIQEFLDDPKNQAELTSQQNRGLKEIERALTGNLFFCFFPNKTTGLVRVRTIQADEIEEIICNPDDAKEPWLYKRAWQEQRFDIGSGVLNPQTTYRWYVDWRFNPKNDAASNETEKKLAAKPKQIGNYEVDWEHPIYHVKTGGLPHHKFGLPDVYQAIDWARAVKEHLEDWATVWRALSQFALKIQTTRGRQGVADAKAKLATTVATGPQNNFMETNPPAMRASTFISTQGVELEPMRTTGARNNPEEARQLVRMVAASAGLPETFFGDADIGNHATSKTLDRPTELKMLDLQSLWKDIFNDMLQYVIDCHGRAPSGLVRGKEVVDERSGDKKVELQVDPETQEPISRHIDITMPEILERDVISRVGAVVNAVTLGGHPDAGLFPMKRTVEMLLTAMGTDDIDEEMLEMFPDEEDMTDGMGVPVPTDGLDPEAGLTEAYRVLKAAIRETGPVGLALLEAAAKNHSNGVPVLK